MTRIFTIARYTFQEAVRNRILYAVMLFAVGLIALSTVAGSASLNNDQRVILNIGMTSMSLFLNAVAIFLGVSTLNNELQRKTIFNVLSKPLARGIYFVGKFLGILLTLSVMTFVMATVLALTALSRESLPPLFVPSIVLLFVECSLVAALSVFFASFSTPYVSGFMTIGVWLACRLLPNLGRFLENADPSVSKTVLDLVFSALPDLSFFTMTTQISYGIPVPNSHVLSVVIYGLSFILVLVIGGAFLFQRRDFI